MKGLYRAGDSSRELRQQNAVSQSQLVKARGAGEEGRLGDGPEVERAPQVRRTSSHQTLLSGFFMSGTAPRVLVF